MLATFTEVLISFMISMFGPCNAGHLPGYGPNDLNYFSSDPPEKELSLRPLEALGGGFKTH
ncbi:MAG: hypothetical protein V3W18_07555 [candidate division Zixibacteria bacterium]